MKMRYGSFRKNKESDKIWLCSALDEDGMPLMLGTLLFTFDKKKIYNFNLDYPANLTPEEKEIFDRENPFWAKFKPSK